MGFLSLFSKRDVEAKRLERERTARENKASKSSRRKSRVELGDWERKYGKTGGEGIPGSRTSSSDERTVAAHDAGALGMEKVASGSTFRSAGTLNRSDDFLPKLNVGYGTAAPAHEIAYIAPTRRSSPSVQVVDLPSSRPVLAPIQPTKQQGTADWNDYVSSRTVAVAAPDVRKRPSRTPSMFSALSRRPVEAPPAPSFRVVRPADDDDDDDVPLAVVRSLSSGSIPRPSTMYDLHSSSSPALLSSSPTLSIPVSRSRSRNSLAIPAVLAAPVARSPTLGTYGSPPLGSPGLSSSPARPATLANVGRRNTLIDLNEPSTFDPYHDRARQDRRDAAEGDRVVVGDRRRKNSAPVAIPNKGKSKVRDGPRIMDFEELEAKHKKRMSLLQGSANEKVTTDAAIAHFQQQQRLEAEQQRKREARRSVDSNLHLLGAPRSGADATSIRKSASASVGSLSALLKRSGAGGSGDKSLSVNDFGASLSSTDRNASTSSCPHPRARSSSTQALVTVPTTSAGPSRSTLPLARPQRPHNARRHSLGTLLEVSSSVGGSASASAAPAAVQVVEEHSAAARKGKVAAWRRESLVPPPPRTSIATPPTGAPARMRTGTGVGEAALLQSTADQAPVKQKKHDWLSY
ncbi:hypothetical protein Rhopal_001666-T1 [Rhodotorula paludigena]|uniref:Uncharacterized protein n=1 Tax=Rhodotorula paludigena TaxID=86838 RepID=A0AAV5G876_9BASI|nr:hypothetical protein Rhopal_001666-T1 [Rhodotorula paludigena]